MVKLVVGLSSPEELAAFNAQQMQRDEEKTGGLPFLRTRTGPRREEEILDGGSIYRVFGGRILCRQKIHSFRDATREDGTPCVLIITEPEIVMVQPRPMRPFQGWRYLRPEDSPPDLNGSGAMSHDMPLSMQRELAALCLL